MPVSIPLIEINDLDQIGETLRAYCFLPDAGGTFGCYSTFKLRPEFKEVANESELGQKLLALLTDGCNPGEEFYEEARARAVCHSNGEIHICWSWDGDGTLLFQFDGIAIENTDCKKSVGWRAVGSPQGLIATEARNANARLDLAKVSAHPVHGAANALLYAVHAMRGCRKFHLDWRAEELHDLVVTGAALGYHDTGRLRDLAGRLAEDMTNLANRYSKAKDRPRILAAAAGARRALALLQPAMKVPA